jgi:hypothetical protein
MKLFDTLLKIQTGKIDLHKSAIFLENSSFWWEWAYFIYHYDTLNNIFYINDLNYPWTENRTSAINIVEHIITKAYKQEMNSLSDILKIIQINKKPKIYCFYRQTTWLIIMDKINLKTIRWKKWNIVGFINPIWDINDSNYVKVHKLKKNLLNFYANKHIK